MKMRLIQFILSVILLAWLLVVAWPLFLILAIILVVTWINFYRKIKVMQKEAFENNYSTNSPTLGSDDVIDAEYKEKDVTNE